MRWVTRRYSKKEINRAGESLISIPIGDPARDQALEVINNWRSCHAYPLQVVKMSILKRSRKIDKEAFISQRIKRLPSIALKLEQNANMKLSQMQDIGGCRSVLSNIECALQLAGALESVVPKNPHRSAIAEPYNYIAEPKEDGYRGIHLIYKYQSEYTSKEPFNGQRIEVQIRSKLQHAWATAVETAQTFTGLALKSRIKSASQSWLRFFALMGSSISAWEKQPNVPGTPEKRADRVAELRDLIEKEKILAYLSGWNDTIQHVEEEPILKNAHSFLLVMDPTKGQLSIIPFYAEEEDLARERYWKAEKENENDPRVQIVLVAVDSIGALRRAYPNYYADTRDFIRAIKREVT